MCIFIFPRTRAVFTGRRTGTRCLTCPATRTGLHTQEIGWPGVPYSHSCGFLAESTIVDEGLTAHNLFCYSDREHEQGASFEAGENCQDSRKTKLVSGQEQCVDRDLVCTGRLWGI
jgi:hypothetical protein